MDSPAPAERAASQFSDDLLSSLLYLCKQLNAERVSTKLPSAEHDRVRCEG
jgi:hypothetical protein